MINVSGTKPLIEFINVTGTFMNQNRGGCKNCGKDKILFKKDGVIYLDEVPFCLCDFKSTPTQEKPPLKHEDLFSHRNKYCKCFEEKPIEWEKELIQKLYRVVGAEAFNKYEWIDYIESLIQQEKEKIIQEIEGMRKNRNWKKPYDSVTELSKRFDKEYNQALEDIISKLK